VAPTPAKFAAIVSPHRLIRIVWPRARIVSLLAFGCLALAFAAADAIEPPPPSPPRAGAESGQDEARDARIREGVKPFSEIMAIARARVTGDFVKIELKRKKHGWEYKVRILTPEGRRTELKIDAVSGEVLEID
jgi:hypothetical protein